MIHRQRTQARRSHAVRIPTRLLFTILVSAFAVPAFAQGDAEAGEKVFGKCKACHHLDGQEAAGPHLNGVIGRDIASVPGYGYSAALTELAGNWDPQPFSEFLTNPTGYAPGTKMAIKLPKPEERANLIAYLQTQP
jgi:cytochrome c